MNALLIISVVAPLGTLPGTFPADSTQTNRFALKASPFIQG
jgi:hypothetical protein